MSNDEKISRKCKKGTSRKQNDVHWSVEEF